MKRIEHIMPILGDAISGAFGGAVFGNLVGYKVAILASFVGAAVFVFSDMKIFQKKNSQKAPS